MNISKKILCLFSLVVLVLPGVIYASYLGAYGAPISFNNIVFNLEGTMWIAFCAIVVICFVVAAILFLTSMGNAEKVSQARSAFIWGIAGVVVGILAYSITTIIGKIL